MSRFGNSWVEFIKNSINKLIKELEEKDYFDFSNLNDDEKKIKADKLTAQIKSKLKMLNNLLRGWKQYISKMINYKERSFQKLLFKDASQRVTRLSHYLRGILLLYTFFFPLLAFFSEKRQKI